MKATIDIPDELYRRVKAKTALEGRRIRDVAIEMFQSWLDDNGRQGNPGKQRHLRAVLRKGEGCFASGVTDLASNPKHLKGLGGGSLGHR